jgi:hypothetical protein
MSQHITPHNTTTFPLMIFEWPGRIRLNKQVP